MKHFYKACRKDRLRPMFEFLKSHFRYDVMNSWNQMKSIANNVKIYNLPTKHSTGDCINAMFDDCGMYWAGDKYIEEFQKRYPHARVFFNGHMSGYLVMTEETLYNKHADPTPEAVLNCDTYEEFKQYVKEDYGSVSGIKRELRDAVEMVEDFDKLCDKLIDALDEFTGCYLELKGVE